MLSSFIRTDYGRRRHLGTPFGPYLDGYLLHRQEQGFTARAIANNLKCVTAFGEYVSEAGLTAVADIGEPVVEEFIRHYRAQSRRCGPARRVPEGSAALVEVHRGSLRSLLGYLRSVGVVPPLAATASPWGEVLAEYLSFLRAHRGFAELTMKQHQRWATAFLESLASRDPSFALTAISCADAEAAVVAIGAKLGRRSRQIMTTTVEAFIRFLRGAGYISASCVPFVPRIKTYALSSLP